MLKNYINITDDVFGNNKKESPSVQDSLYEVMYSDKYNIKNYNKANDVPIAEDYFNLYIYFNHKYIYTYLNILIIFII